MIVYGANACAFIVYSPPGVSDAVRTDTTITLTYYWPVGTILSPRWDLRSSEYIGALPVQYGTSSSFFEAYYYHPTAAGRLGQVFQNIFTSPDRRKSMVTAAIAAVGGATINPLAALGGLDAVGGFLYELTQKKGILARVEMSVRVCNYSVCTPDKSFSIPIQQFN